MWLYDAFSPRIASASCPPPTAPPATPYPINGVSPLIFRPLICDAPKAPLIRSECDNLNSQTKQATNKKKDPPPNRSGLDLSGWGEWGVRF